jgi:hypothetical protein
MMRFTSQGLVFSLAFISPILAYFKKMFIFLKKKSQGVWWRKRREESKCWKTFFSIAPLLLPPSSYNGRQLPAPSLCKLSKGRKNRTVQDIKKKNTFSLTDKLSSTFTQFIESKWVRHIVNLGQRKGKTFFRNKFNDG